MLSLAIAFLRLIIKNNKIKIVIEIAKGIGLKNENIS
jgi:hypothetical protein